MQGEMVLANVQKIANVACTTRVPQKTSIRLMQVTDRHRLNMMISSPKKNNVNK
jgi:hypothetical protein